MLALFLGNHLVVLPRFDALRTLECLAQLSRRCGDPGADDDAAHLASGGGGAYAIAIYQPCA